MMGRAWIAGLAVAGMLCLLIYGYSSWLHAAAVSLSLGEPCPEATVAEAWERVDGFFGPHRSRPILRCLNGPRAGLNVVTGTARFAPFVRPLLVIGPKGRTVDIIAHELAHGEISARTSPLLRSYKLPVWFDEGLAMQLDLRVTYGPDVLEAYRNDPAIKLPGLDEIGRPSGFFVPGDQGKAHYALAKCVVGVWLDQGPAISDFLSKVGWFWRFPRADFAEAEAACR